MYPILCAYHVDISKFRNPVHFDIGLIFQLQYFFIFEVNNKHIINDWFSLSKMLLFAKNFIKQLKLPLKGFEPEPFKGAIIFFILFGFEPWIPVVPHSDKSRFFVQKSPKFVDSILKIFGPKIIYTLCGFIFYEKKLMVVSQKNSQFQF